MKRKKQQPKKTRAEIRTQGNKHIEGWTREDFEAVAPEGDVVIAPLCERHPFNDELRRLHSGILRGRAL